MAYLFVAIALEVLAYVTIWIFGGGTMVLFLGSLDLSLLAFAQHLHFTRSLP